MLPVAKDFALFLSVTVLLCNAVQQHLEKEDAAGNLAEPSHHGKKRLMRREDKTHVSSAPASQPNRSLFNTMDKSTGCNKACIDTCIAHFSFDASDCRGPRAASWRAADNEQKLHYAKQNSFMVCVRGQNGCGCGFGQAKSYCEKCCVKFANDLSTTTTTTTAATGLSSGVSAGDNTNTISMCGGSLLDRLHAGHSEEEGATKRLDETTQSKCS
jgi:hypothetical protein